MNDVPETFGRRANAADSTDALLALEQATGRSERFARLDALLGDMMVRALQGEQLLTLKTSEQHDQDSIVLNGLRADQRTFVADTFGLEQQRSRGAWFLPEDIRLNVGLIHLPAHML